jgi:hypothetical protein
VRGRLRGAEMGRKRQKALESGKTSQIGLAKTASFLLAVAASRLRVLNRVKERRERSPDQGIFLGLLLHQNRTPWTLGVAAAAANVGFHQRGADHDRGWPLARLGISP